MYTVTSFKLIQPEAHFTAARSESMRQILDECLQRATQIVLVDLQNVTFIDSFGLGLLVSMQSKLRRSNSKLYLCAPPEQMDCLLELANVKVMFEIFSSREEFDTEIVKKNRLVLVQ